MYIFCDTISNHIQHLKGNACLYEVDNTMLNVTNF